MAMCELNFACLLQAADPGSEHLLDTEEEEEAKFKSGRFVTLSARMLFFAASLVSRFAAKPRLMPSAVRTGVVQRPKDKILLIDPKEITYEMVQKKLLEISMARGKTTRIDRQDQV